MVINLTARSLCHAVIWPAWTVRYTAKVLQEIDLKMSVKVHVLSLVIG